MPSRDLTFAAELPLLIAVCKTLKRVCRKKYSPRRTMPAHFIVSVTIPDPANRVPYDNYVAKVRPIVERHGGEYLVRSENIRHIAGEWRPDRVIVIRFPDIQALQNCFASSEYKEIEQLRTCSVNASAVIVIEEHFQFENAQASAGAAAPDGSEWPEAQDTLRELCQDSRCSLARPNFL